jgi:hypothetical protein
MMPLLVKLKGSASIIPIFTTSCKNITTYLIIK